MARLPLVLPALLALAGCGGGAAAQSTEPRPSATATAAPAEEPRTAVGHLQALQEVADANGDTRAAGTAGDRASQAYVASRLRAAGWTVRFQPVSFPFFEERSPARLAGADEGSDFRALAYSGSGTVRARTTLARGEGCAAGDWSRVQRGRVAVVLRGTCTFASKARFAQRRGAAALLVVSDDGVRGATLGSPGTRIPVLIVDADTGRAVLRRGSASLRVDAVSERRQTRNVIATRAGDGTGRVVMAGAHLDSVTAGPGANDNATGSAALLAAAERLGETDRPVRLAWWGAEELGLLGSREYVGDLAGAERRRIAAYVNLDMVGTPDGRVQVNAPDADLRRTLTAALRREGRDPRPSETLNGGSDHASFSRAGVDSAFLFTGLDRCYHRACDTASKVDDDLLTDVSAATVTALRRLASA